jgi:predicted RNA-binding protein with RPS1 domain
LNPWVCEERQRLAADYVQAVRDVMQLHDWEAKKIVCGEEAPRINIALRAAQEKRERAKHSLLDHIAEHGC